jgi:deoxyadenosine/deoxycytidine kinase/NTP pyrophosphatase (non-canonical NTP hydrolase)
VPTLDKQSLPHPTYIIIEGAIGVGKTTLARMLHTHLNTELLFEVFEENPFLSKFYEAREQYAFQTQMFFLLSRYRQQQQVQQMRTRRALISDYMFAKDWLFAKLNLAGDEWVVYRQIHEALAEQIETPDLVVYLQADTDVLMGRIAQRDRPYERDMDRAYIESLRQAYEQFFATYQETPLLIIDTNPLNFVARPEDLRSILGRIQGALQEGIIQRRLPQLEEPSLTTSPGENVYSLPAYQRFHRELDRRKGFITDLYFNYLCLSEEIGELGSELAQLWREETHWVMQGQTSEEARQLALKTQQAALKSELADCMAYLLKLANYAGINLEDAYLEKMSANQGRVWE